MTTLLLTLLLATAATEQPQATAASALISAPVDLAQDQGTAKAASSDPNSTRLIFGPTGRSLRKGEVYVGVYEVVLPFVQVGVTDRLSIGAGTPLLFGDFDRPFWFTPKFKVMERGSTAASVGVMHFLNIDDHANIGVAYGVVTRGGADSSITVGGGAAYARWDVNDGERDTKAGAAVLMLGGDHRVAKGVKLVTENYVFRRGGFVSGGVRFFGEKLSADIGLMMPLDTDSVIALPIVNIVRRF
ncbi:MAG: hypothetical protein RLZZ53_1603 [Acidobacteriota bacterium]